MNIHRCINFLFSGLLVSLFLVMPVVSNATVVRMETSLGVIEVQLYDNQAPLTVANFLSYVDSGAYNQSFFHRSVSDFIIQGGGYAWVEAKKSSLASIIPPKPPVINEFSTSRSNLRGTIAMAKLGNDPNSATNQWFFNLKDNSAELDNQNGGFTVFGKVSDSSMLVVDAIAALARANAGGPFTDLPLISFPPANGQLGKANLALISAVSSNHANSDASQADRVFAYLEAIYPEYISPANPLSPANSGSLDQYGYYYRYYSSTNAYVGVANDTVYYLGSASENTIISIGSLSSWFALAVAAGY